MLFRELVHSNRYLMITPSSANHLSIWLLTDSKLTRVWLNQAKTCNKGMVFLSREFYSKAKLSHFLISSNYEKIHNSDLKVSVLEAGEEVTMGQILTNITTKTWERDSRAIWCLLFHHQIRNKKIKCLNNFMISNTRALLSRIKSKATSLLFRSRWLRKMSPPFASHPRNQAELLRSFQVSRRFSLTKWTKYSKGEGQMNSKCSKRTWNSWT